MYCMVLLFLALCKRSGTISLKKIRLSFSVHIPTRRCVVIDMPYRDR